MSSITKRLLDQARFDELPDDLPTWHIGRLAYPDDPGQQASFIDYLAKGIERGKLEACDHSFLLSDEQPGVLKATCIGGDEDYRRYKSTESVPRCTYKALRTFLERYPYQFTPLGPYIARWLRADPPATRPDEEVSVISSSPWGRVAMHHDGIGWVKPSNHSKFHYFIKYREEVVSICSMFLGNYIHPLEVEDNPIANKCCANCLRNLIKYENSMKSNNG